MNRILSVLAVAGIVLGGAVGLAAAQEEAGHAAAEPTHFPILNPVEEDWSFAGPFGTYDRAQLQRGLQVNVLMQGDRAAFYRVLQKGETGQIALVLLNKGAAPAAFEVREMLQAGRWRAALGGGDIDVAEGGALQATVPAHGVAVYLLDAAATQPQLRAALDRARIGASPRG